MSDVEFWNDSGAPAEVSAWLVAARAEEPRPGAVDACAALIAGLGAELAVAEAIKSSFPAASGVVSGKAASLALVKWGVGGILAGSVLAGGAVGLEHAMAPPPSATITTSPAVRVTSTTPVPPAPLPETEPVQDPSAPAVARRAAPATTASAVPGSDERLESVPSLPNPDPRLAAELDLLKRARESLDAGDAKRAAELLGDHGRRFGSASPLSPEARYLRFELLLANNRIATARSLAREIIERDPNGPHADRARALLEKK